MKKKGNMQVYVKISFCYTDFPLETKKEAPKAPFYLVQVINLVDHCTNTAVTEHFNEK